MRRNEIDWIRNIGVLLFIFHTAPFLIVFLMGYIVYGDNDYLEYIDKKKTKV